MLYELIIIVRGYPKEEGLLDYLGCPWGPDCVRPQCCVGSVTPGAFLEAPLEMPSSLWDGVGQGGSNGGYVARFLFRRKGNSQFSQYNS
jgi:hypothetical protein